MIDKKRFEFRYFFNAGLDRRTCICDGEGSDVFEIDDNGGKHYIGSIYGTTPDEIEGMDEDEVESLFFDNAIIPNLY